MIVVIINLRFGVWVNERPKRGWWGATPGGAVPNLGTLCLEVQKSAWATQGRTDARSYIFIYVLIYFMFIAVLIPFRGWAFFNRLGGRTVNKDIAIPPGYRRVLKNGRL